MEKKNEKKIFWLMMMAVFLGNFSAILSMSTMMVPLPGLMKLFDTELGVIQWAITGFTLATGIIAPTVGYLCERFGVKRTYVVTLVGFLGTSFLCATAWNVETLIIFRSIQGLFCGVIIPVTMTIIYTYVKRSEQAFAVSMWSMSGVLAPACGPTISGVIMQYLNWHWIFLMNVPICVIAVVISIKFIPKDDHSAPSVHRFDLRGLIQGSLGTTFLLMAFSFSQEWGITNVKTVALALLGLGLIALFVRHELSLETPLLNFRVFHYKSFGIGSYSNFFITILLNCSIFLLPLYLQTIRGFTAIETGLIILVGPVAVAIVSPIVGKLYIRSRAKKIALLGIGGMFAGFVMLSQIDMTTQVAYIMVAIIILEGGMGAAKIPAMNYGMEALPRGLSAHGSGMTSWLKQGAGALAVGMITSVVLLRTQSHLGGIPAKEAGEGVYNLAYAGAMSDVFMMAVLGVAIFGLSIFFWMKPKTDDLAHIEM